MNWAELKGSASSHVHLPPTLSRDVDLHVRPRQPSHAGKGFTRSRKPLLRGRKFPLVKLQNPTSKPFGQGQGGTLAHGREPAVVIWRPSEATPALATST